MLKKQIKLGSSYTAKVSNKLVTVQIQSESKLGGWIALNVDTGRTIRIKSAGKLRREV